MKKSILTILSIVFLFSLVLSTISYANNEVKNGIHNFTDGVVDGVENLGSDVRSRCWCG